MINFPKSVSLSHSELASMNGFEVQSLRIYTDPSIWGISIRFGVVTQSASVDFLIFIFLFLFYLSPGGALRVLTLTFGAPFLTENAKFMEKGSSNLGSIHNLHRLGL